MKVKMQYEIDTESPLAGHAESLISHLDDSESNYTKAEIEEIVKIAAFLATQD